MCALPVENQTQRTSSRVTLAQKNSIKFFILSATESILVVNLQHKVLKIKNQAILKR